MARVASGDELKLQLDPVGERAYGGKEWEGLGQVIRITDGEVALMMHAGNVPLDIADGYQVCVCVRKAVFCRVCRLELLVVYFRKI